MTYRPKTHISADLAVNFLQRAFVTEGWTVEVIDQDYGEDLLARVFENGEATQKWFFVQSKSVDEIDKYKLSTGEISYSFDSRHILQWMNFRHPVIVAVYDTRNEMVYWQDVQEALRLETEFNGQSKSIRIPNSNTLKIDQIGSLQRHIAERYQIYREVSETVDILVKRLDEKYGLRIDAGAEDGAIWLPPGKFVPSEGEDVEVLLFGRLGRLITQATKITGKNHQETFIEIIEAGLRS